ncbi:MAG: HAMP domain-containing protein, partial [Proteobacteria bacterium]
LSLALKPVADLTKASIALGVAMLALSSLVALWVGVALTRKLRILVEQTSKISQGDLDIALEVTGGDEVGKLGRSVHAMAQELKRFLREMVQKARMDEELRTARMVQETLFPEGDFRLGLVEIAGASESASECGGDFWFRWHSGKDAFFILADATGHGVPAALITSAARAAIAVAESLSIHDLNQIVRILDNAIRETSKGKILMTAIVGRIDPDRNLQFINCSHEAPILFDLNQNRLEILSGGKNPRLGDIEEGERNYEITKCSLEDDQIMFLYTDGLTEAANEAGAVLGARQFTNIVKRNLLRGPEFNSQLKLIIENVKVHTKGRVDDDMTVMAIRTAHAA